MRPERGRCPSPLALISLLVSLAASSAMAQEFRVFEPIPAPAPWRKAGNATFRPVARGAVEQAVQAVIDAWNRPDLEQRLSDRYYDWSRLLDTLVTVPRDASLRLLAIEGVEILSQRNDPPTEAGARPARVSTVSAVVRTQIEYNDPARGLVRLPGRNEYVFEVREETAP